MFSQFIVPPSSMSLPVLLYHTHSPIRKLLIDLPLCLSIHNILFVFVFSLISPLNICSYVAQPCLRNERFSGSISLVFPLKRTTHSPQIKVNEHPKEMTVTLIIRRTLTTCSKLGAKQIPNNLKGRSKSSQEWLTRQLADPYVEKAKMMNYRCRSAFKLLEIDEKYNIIQPGDCVIDCGAAPGSWTQVAVEKCNANGRMEKKPKGAVFSMDLLHFHSVPVSKGTIDMYFCSPQWKQLFFFDREQQYLVAWTLRKRRANSNL